MSGYFQKYRVNYGNGQASSSFKTQREAEVELEKEGIGFIQGFVWEFGDEEGEWFSVPRRGS